MNRSSDRTEDVSNDASVEQDRAGEILVTGAAGFIGGHITHLCLESGWRIATVDVRPLPKASGRVTEYRERADAAHLLRDIRAGRFRAVIHQAGNASTLATDWEELNDSNIQQPLSLAEACAQSRTPFVYASSHSVYGSFRHRTAAAEGDEDNPEVCSGPLNLYARSKLTLDREMTARFGSDTPWVGLRYTNVFGTGESSKGPMASILYKMLRDTSHGIPLRLFADTINACRDFVPVEVVASVAQHLVTHQVPPGLYNLGSGLPVSFGTLLEWCAGLAEGNDLTVRLVPNEISAKYQYWTCADMTRTRRAIPAVADLTVAELRSAAEKLFYHFEPSRAGTGL
jgi:ADP-L-glycero-D-manno-heptose 6-epimerase